MHLVFDRAKARAELSAWFHKTSWHGVSDWASSEHTYAKCLWTLVLIVSTLFFTVNVYAHIADYCKGETWSLVTYYKEDLVNGAPFPNVTVCSLNLASEKKLKGLDMNYDAAAYILDGVLSSGAEETSNPEREKKTEEEFLKYIEKHNVSTKPLTEWTRMIAPICEDLFDGCLYGNPATPYAKFNCCENARELFLLDHGRCFVLYPPKEFISYNKQLQEGEDLGLHLYLNPEVADYAPVYQASVPDVGIILYLGFTPENSILTTPVALSPGTHTWVGMRVEETNVEIKKQVIPFLYPLNIPQLPCYLGHELKIINAEYTYETCRLDCTAQYAYNLCGCVFFHSVKPGYPVCDPVSMQKCHPMMANFTSRDTWWAVEALLDCRSKQCKKECYKSTVEVGMSATKTPAPSYLGIYRQMIYELEGAMHSEETLQQFAAVDIFFDSTQIRVVEMRERYTVETLISNIGGTLGVYAGISLITLYQMIVFFCRGLWQSCSSIQPSDKIVSEKRQPCCASCSCVN